MKVQRSLYVKKRENRNRLEPPPLKYFLRLWLLAEIFKTFYFIFSKKNQDFMKGMTMLVKYTMHSAYK